MKVMITDPAKEELKKIFQYYRRRGLGIKGRRIRREVLEKSKLLQKHPHLGPEEENLKHLEQGHRYMIIKPFYKMIYLVTESVIYITDIFDTRQDPERMKP